MPRVTDPVWVQGRDEWTERDVYYRIELPCIPATVAMEENGILLDSEHLQKLSIFIDAELEILRTGALRGLNPNSPKQVANELFNNQRLPRLNGDSTDAKKVLRRLLARDSLPVESRTYIHNLLRHRELAKLEGTYVDALPLLVRPDGRIHAQFLQFGTDTGRYSSREPNLQNLASHTEDEPWRANLGPEIKRAFVPAPGMVFVKVDYSQVELRIIAMASRDPALVEPFANGEDIHQALLTQLGWPKESRWMAKQINFGIPYGMEGETLRWKLGGVPKSEAESYLAAYRRTHPLVTALFQLYRAQALHTGWVETLWGRRFYTTIPAERWLREAALREAANMPIQGGGADIMKLFMPVALAIGQEFGALLLVQEHDALLFECPRRYAWELLSELQTTASKMIQAIVPIVLDGGVGDNWTDILKENGEHA